MSDDDQQPDSAAQSSTVSLESPTLAAGADAASDAIDRGRLLTIVGRWRIDGVNDADRPAASDESGVAVVKPDGTVIVHGLEGETPLATAAAGTELTVCAADDELVLEAHQGRDDDFAATEPTEAFVVRFETVTHLTAVGGAREPVPDPPRGRHASSGPQRSPEAALRDRLLERPDLVEPGFRPLATERETPAGPVDVYGQDASGRTVVVELKSRRAGPDAVSQLRRYVDALERDLHAETTVRGILVAPSVTSRADRLLARYGLEFVALESPDEREAE